MSEIEGGTSEEERAEAEQFEEMIETGELTPEEASKAKKDQSPMDVLIEKKHEEAKKFHEMYEKGQATAEDLEKSLGQLITPEQFVEVLNRQKEGRVLNYLCGFPGVASHVIMAGQEGYMKLRRLIEEGKSIEKDREKGYTGEFGSFGSASEQYISLHLARWAGDSHTFSGSGYGWSDVDLPAYGFVLKPEFFMEKIANVTEQEIDEAEGKTGVTQPSTGRWAGDEGHYLRLSTGIRQAILRGERSKGIYLEDYGIRAITVKNGKFVPVPISAEDVVCFFEVDEEGPISEGYVIHRDEKGRFVAGTPSKQFQLRVKMFHPDGRQFSEAEVDELDKKAEEAKKTYDRDTVYFHTKKHEKLFRPYEERERPVRKRKERND